MIMSRRWSKRDAAPEKLKARIRPRMAKIAPLIAPVPGESLLSRLKKRPSSIAATISANSSAAASRGRAMSSASNVGAPIAVGHSVG
jgi:hypothetical protein